MSNQGRIGQLLTRVASAFEQSQALDGFGDAVAGVVQRLTGAEEVKTALSGSWLGHALHPLLTDLPIGLWTSAVALDVLGGEDAEDAAELLVGLGNVSAVAAAVTGLADWSDAYGPEKRLGMFHGLANVAGLALMSGSWAARQGGARGLGKTLGLAGYGVATAAAYLGGHLVYARGTGVSHAGFDIDQSVTEWTDVAAEADLAEGQPLKASAGDVEVFLLRQGDQVMALANHCTHAGGPLDEGAVADGAVTCPWHGSRFRVADGCVLRGPASFPEPRFEARVRDGRVEVRA